MLLERHRLVQPERLETRLRQLPAGHQAGHKYEDENANGADDGAGDANLVGWTIRVYNDNDASGTLNAGDTLEASTDTDALGNYSFDLDPDDYVVCEEAQDAGNPGTWFQSEPSNAKCNFDTLSASLADGGYAEAVSSGSSAADRDFGNFRQGSISGHKYEDENANGADDGAGDANLVGWTIRVYNDNDAAGTLNAATRSRPAPTPTRSATTASTSTPTTTSCARRPRTPATPAPGSSPSRATPSATSTRQRHPGRRRLRRGGQLRQQRRRPRLRQLPAGHHQRPQVRGRERQRRRRGAGDANLAAGPSASTTTTTPPAR